MKTSFPIYLIANQLFSNSQAAVTFANTKQIGELKQGKVIYSDYEALYLVETKKADIIHNKNNKPFTENQLLLKFSKNKNFLVNFTAYKDLKSKGYIVKTASKFGSDFRVYKPGDNHARYIVFPTNSKKIEINDIIAKTRISHSSGKVLLLAFVDSEQDISYFTIDWTKL
jgi:tRNA-intron endonuclease, archaea type